MTASTEREFRRFTAVALVHRNLTSADDVVRCLGSSVESPEGVQGAPNGWSVTRLQFLARRKFYPAHVGTATRDRGASGYAHDIYVCIRDLGGSIGPAVVLASPYVAFLHQMVVAVTNSLDGPAVQYLGVDMRRVYAALDAGGNHSAVNRVTMQVIGERNADIVTLAGRRPLHSKIHETLAGVTVPYGIGVNIEHNDSTCRVGIDRHGRIGWFQTSEDRIGHPLALLDRIHAENAILKVRRFPLDAESKDTIVSLETV